MGFRKFLLALAFLFFCAPLVLHAQQYTVRKGDSLYTIARQNNLSVAELRALNKLAGNRLQPGQTLLLSADADPAPGVAVTAKPDRKATTDENRKTVASGYVVKQGDTLSAIAGKFGLTVKQLRSRNHLSSSKLRLGQKLVVGTVSVASARKKPEAPVKEAVPSAADSEEETPVQPEYTVVKGDTLGGIARKNNLSVEELKRLNDLTSHRLKVGQKLVVAATATEEGQMSEVGYRYRTEKVYRRVYRGDTLAGISRKYGVSVADLKKLNKLSGTNLKVGRKLLVKVSKVRVPSQREPVLEIANNKPGETENKLPDEFSVDGIAGKLLTNAFEFLDVPYRLGGFSQFGIDCSGLVKKAFSEIGVNLPRTARTQFTEGVPIELSELLPGDLLFFTNRRRHYPTHVAIYVGNGMILHASLSAHRVVVDSFEKSAYLKSCFIGARRILPDLNAATED